jgi:predicted RNase H-like nuclease
MICIMPGLRVAGVDGCPGGWVAAVVTDGRLDGWQLVGDPTAFAPLGERVCVDIPIGLPDRGRRSLERAARLRLPGRGSTIFPTPVRAVLGAASYAEACSISRACCDGLAVSRQTWLITPKIASVDAALAAAPALDDSVGEAHPELAFAAMGGQVLAPKRTAAGRVARLDVLARWLGDDVLPLLPRRLGTARPDDLLDALACAWVAQRWARGQAEVIADPGVPEDSTGRPMRILV